MRDLRGGAPGARLLHGALLSAQEVGSDGVPQLGSAPPRHLPLPPLQGHRNPHTGSPYRESRHTARAATECASLCTCVPP